MVRYWTVLTAMILLLAGCATGHQLMFDDKIQLALPVRDRTLDMQAFTVVDQRPEDARRTRARDDGLLVVDDRLNPAPADVIKSVLSGSLKPAATGRSIVLHRFDIVLGRRVPLDNTFRRNDTGMYGAMGSLMASLMDEARNQSNAVYFATLRVIVEVDGKPIDVDREIRYIKADRDARVSELVVLVVDQVAENINDLLDKPAESPAVPATQTGTEANSPAVSTPR